MDVWKRSLLEYSGVNPILGAVAGLCRGRMRLCVGNWRLMATAEELGGCVANRLLYAGSSQVAAVWAAEWSASRSGLALITQRE